MTTASSSVLLLGWDHTSEALPLAHALTTPANSQLWLAEPLAAHAAPPGVPVRLLGQAVPAGLDLSGIGRASPTAPYTGQSESSTVQNAPASHIGAAEQTTSPTADFKVPAAPYVGATHPAAAAVLPLPPTPAEPGPTEALELLGDLALTPVEEAQPLAVTDAALAPTLPLEILTDDAPQASAPVSFPPMEDPAVPEAHALLDAVEENGDDLNFRIIQYARHAARIAHETTFEVIFAPDWPSWLAGVEIRHLMRRPLVLRVRQLAADHATPATRGWAEALERLTLPHADRVLVSDQAMAERLCALYPIPASRVHVLAADATPTLTAALVLETHLRP